MAVPVIAPPVLGPPRPEFLPRPDIGPRIDTFPVTAAHPTESVATQIRQAAVAHGNGEGMVGLRLVDAGDNILEVTDHHQEARSRDTFGVKGLGFEYFSNKDLTGGSHPVKGSRDLFGGSEFAGKPKITKTVDQVADIRTVRVTSKNGDPVKYLRINGNEAFDEFLNHNTPDPHAAHGDGHGHHGPIDPPEKMRLRTPDKPLGFKDFGWVERPTHPGTGDTIPVPADPNSAVSVAMLEAQRERLDLNSLEHVTWTDARGRKQTIVWDGIETEHQVSEGERFNKLPRDLRDVVTYGEDADSHNAYLNAKRDVRTVKVLTNYITPGGSSFKRIRTMNLDELQAHFNGIAATRAKDPHLRATDPKWDLPPTDPADITSAALRQEELYTLRAAGIPAHLGRFALAPVVATMPSREVATDPGVAIEEAVGLLLSPDFVASGAIPEADWHAEITRLMDPASGAEGDAARRAARALKDTIDELGSEAVGIQADSLLKDCRKLMGKVGLDAQANQLSISWAYKILSKRHINAVMIPDETRDERLDMLTPGDPMAPTSIGRQVRRELIDIQVAETVASAARTLGMRQQYDSATGSVIDVPYYIVNSTYIKTLPAKIQNQLKTKLSQDPSNPLAPIDLLAMGSLIDSYWDRDD